MPKVMPQPQKKFTIFIFIMFLGIYGVHAFVVEQAAYEDLTQDPSLHHSIPNGPHRLEKRSFDLGGLFDYAMGTIYSLTTYPYPYPSLYGHSYGQRLVNPLLSKFGPAGFGGGGLGGLSGYRNNRYSYSPGSYATFHATRGYGFH